MSRWALVHALEEWEYNEVAIDHAKIGVTWGRDEHGRGRKRDKMKSRRSIGRVERREGGWGLIKGERIELAS